MQVLHYANVGFDFELSGRPPPSRSGPFLCLQHLPLLWADKDEGVVLDVVPDEESRHHFEMMWPSSFQWPLLYSKNNPPAHCLLEPWGVTPPLLAWAHEHALLLSAPDVQACYAVNSKAFSFLHSPRLPEAQLIHSQEELLSWAKRTKGKRVLKELHGFAGQGHLFFEKVEELSHLTPFPFQALLAEPWVERIADFSTQWVLSPQGEGTCLGLTILHNSTKGVYQGTSVLPSGSIPPLLAPFFEEHIQQVRQIFPFIQATGYFGPIGVDAMLYQSDRVRLHPIVEINPRKTVSLAALLCQRKHFPQQQLTLRYGPRSALSRGLLPSTQRFQLHLEVSPTPLF